MKIMNTLNEQYQSSILRPITLPVENTLTPEEEAQAREDKVTTLISIDTQLQEKTDQQREILVASVANQSKQMQAEIYLSVALEEDAQLYTNNQYMLESLQKTQEQNNAVKAYAAYQGANEIINPRF